MGTEGRDVIVRGTSSDITGGGGDDLICLDSPSGSEQIFTNVFYVDAGSGNDLVDSTAMGSGYYLIASLGDGSDTFAGGVAREDVAAGAAGFIRTDVPSESERDVIDTGDPDYVVIHQLVQQALLPPTPTPAASSPSTAPSPTTAPSASSTATASPSTPGDPAAPTTPTSPPGQAVDASQACG